MKGWKRWVGLLLIGTLTTMVACEKNPVENEPKEEAPVLPPTSSMTMDLSTFSNTGLQKSTSFTKYHFTNAALRLLAINTVVAVHLAIPVAVFAAAASQQPEFESDGKFHWRYSVSYEGKTFEADLAGWIDVPNKQVVWEMRISCNALQPQLDNFLWYKGRSELDATSGYWLFYDYTQPTASVEVARIDWTIVSESEQVLLFTGLEQGSDIEDDTLEYLWKGSERTVTLTNATTADVVVINWDATTGAGCLQAPDYNEGKESCWDENQNDIQEAPTLPPLSSMELDLSLFNDSALYKSNSYSKLHFTNAALRLFLINTVVSVEMAVPVIVFAAAASQQPEMQSDGKYHWVYSITNGGNTFEADLAGWVDVPNTQIIWEMYITCNTLNPQLDKFLWYTGRCNIIASSGYWLFYDHTQPDAAVEAARIDWTIDEDDVRTLLFSVIKPGGELEDDTLEYRWEGSIRTVTLYDASENQTAIIHWDAATGAGCLQVPDYNDGQESCWDENQNDIN